MARSLFRWEDCTSRRWNFTKKKEPKIKAWSHINSVNEAVWHVSAAAHERCECDSTKNEEGHTRKPSEYFTSDSSIPKLFLMMRWLLMCRVHAHLEKFSDFLMAWVEKLPEHPSREARPLLPSILASVKMGARWAHIQVCLRHCPAPHCVESQHSFSAGTVWTSRIKMLRLFESDAAQYLCRSLPPFLPAEK